MNPLCRSVVAVIRPIGRARVIGDSRCPMSRTKRDSPTVIGARSRRGTRSGASMLANVAPGTPASANSPDTRSGCRVASSNAVLTPTDHPATTAWSSPASSSTATASSTNASMPTRSGSAGRADPPTPRWFQETTRTPQSRRSSAGQAYGFVPRPLQSSTGVPGASLVHARSTVPSALVTS